MARFMIILNNSIGNDKQIDQKLTNRPQSCIPESKPFNIGDVKHVWDFKTKISMDSS